MSPRPDAISGSCNETSTVEKQALVQFYNSMNGEHWIEKGFWLSNNVSVCSWGGVECNENCEVIGLYIGTNNLKGVFPSDIRMLASLGSLHLDCNSITGGLEFLTNLTVIQLGSNEINESLPNLQSATLLDLSYNYLTGTIPSDFSSLNQLTNLVLNNNQLFGTISEIFTDMVGLQFLSLGHNNFTGSIPSSLKDCYFLTYLDLSYNMLSGSIPKNFIHFYHIQNTLLNNNSLTGNINIIVNYFSGEVNLSSNMFSGEFPNLSETLITALSLSNNNFSGSVGFNIQPYILDIRNNTYASCDPIIYTDKLLLPAVSGLLTGNLWCPYLENNPDIIKRITIIAVDGLYYNYTLCQIV